MRTTGCKALGVFLLLAFPSLLFATTNPVQVTGDTFYKNSPQTTTTVNGQTQDEGPSSVGSSSNSTYTGPTSLSDVTTGTGPKSLAGIANNHFGQVYSIFRVLSFWWIMIFGIFLAISIAFGESAQDEVRNYFLGMIIIVGANILIVFWKNFLS